MDKLNATEQRANNTRTDCKLGQQINRKITNQQQGSLTCLYAEVAELTFYDSQLFSNTVLLHCSTYKRRYKVQIL